LQHRDSNSDLSVVRPVASRYTDCATSASLISTQGFHRIMARRFFTKANEHCSGSGYFLSMLGTEVLAPRLGGLSLPVLLSVFLWRQSDGAGPPRRPLHTSLSIRLVSRRILGCQVVLRGVSTQTDCSRIDPKILCRHKTGCIRVSCVARSLLLTSLLVHKMYCVSLHIQDIHTSIADLLLLNSSFPVRDAFSKVVRPAESDLIACGVWETYTCCAASYKHIIIIIIMALRPFVGPWPTFQFLHPIHGR
jgi:hypothetical protein